MVRYNIVNRNMKNHFHLKNTIISSKFIYYNYPTLALASGGFTNLSTAYPQKKQKTNIPYTI